ncbi:tetratricopeptide repeat-containing sensor histidine kinase [Labilibaculum sp.]|uniref:ATP-binding protein n=1 Tax=Labilibaculum sp. TaxID=2060723 RepID=UPI002AA6F922|nr:tetratricopeptide repeat-containing sensor histidine kinase [Labilibaculum sp.]MBN2597426.1 tetratricopeptide repeat-containing sensor histidine kinase [Marinifilaceae bacterium]
MRKLVLLLIIFIFVAKPLAFTQNLDSIDKKLDSISDIHLKIEFLNEWTGKNYRKLPVEAIHYAKEAIKYAEKSENHSGAGNALIRIALVHFRKEDYTQSISFFNKALDKFILSNDSLGINNTYLNRGIVYRNMNKYNLAIVDLFTCMEYFENNNNTFELPLSYNSIGLIYKALKKHNKALEYYYKAEKIYKERNQISFLYTSNTNIANILSIQNNFQEALDYYKKNLDVLKEAPNKYKLAQTYHNIGSCFFEMRQYSMALEYLNQSLELKEKIGNKNLLISTINSLAHVFYAQNNYKDALEYRKKALALAIKSKNIEYQKDCNEELFKIFTRLHVADSALHYFSEYELLKDSIFNHENLKQIAEIQEKYESEKKETQITLLEKENKSKMWQRNSLIVLLILLLGYAIFIVRSYYRNKKTHQLLQLQNERIQWHKTLLDQKNEALSDSNKTKNRLFQIISHDLRSPLASVYNIAQLIKIFIQQRKYQLLEESCNDMEECISNVLSLTDNLLSWSLNQSGKLPCKPVILSLKPLLENNLRTYSSVAKQKNIHLQLLLEETLFVFADRQMLDTVIRNLINNSLKFTPAGGIIAIGAKQRDQFVELWIKDSGIGIAQDQIAHLFEVDHSQSYIGTNGEKGNGLGLLLCKQFIEQNKGEIWVESTLNLGTTFRITIPAAENTNEIASILTSNANSN